MVSRVQEFLLFWLCLLIQIMSGFSDKPVGIVLTVPSSQFLKGNIANIQWDTWKDLSKHTGYLGSAEAYQSRMTHRCSVSQSISATSRTSPPFSRSEWWTLVVYTSVSQKKTPQNNTNNQTIAYDLGKVKKFWWRNFRFTLLFSLNQLFKENQCWNTL